MDLPSAQVFFDRYADILAREDIDAIMLVYTLPLSMHFEGSEIVLSSYPALHEMIVHHCAQLRAEGVTDKSATVIATETGLQARSRVSVDWRFRAHGQEKHTKVDYFFEQTGGMPKIGMVDFDVPVPESYARFMLPTIARRSAH